MKNILNQLKEIPIKKRKNTRGKRNSVKSILKSLIFSGFNPNGIKRKMTTVKKFIRETNSSIVTMQETKSNQVGQIHLDGFYTYEHIRTNKQGGGVALGAHKDLQPTFISDGGEGVEAIAVDIHLKELSITVISAYGPQEGDDCEKKTKFWNYLGEQANRAITCGNGFVLQGDLNAWLGPDFIKGDSRRQNRNGKLFAEFLKQYDLTCVNSMALAEGVVTRIRSCMGTLETSTIDFYVVCERVIPFVISMKIDNGIRHTLTNFAAKKNTG